LFPELVRFPGSFAEEKLLRPPDSKADTAAPTLTLLVPTSRRDVHLRACAVIAARLGQLGYLSAEDCRVAWLENWQAENQERNGIAVGVRDELTSLSLPTNIGDKLASLQPGQGLIAEFITDTLPNHRRWLLLAGADDSGLENAVLTLGSAPALAAAPPNPILIDATPTVSTRLEAATQPEATRVTLKDLGVSQVRLSGLHTSVQAVSGWRLPPGFDLASGILDVHFSHSPALLAPGSWVDVLVDGLTAGTIQLTPKNAVGGSAKVTLPKGFAGRDPMLLTFRAHLDVPPVDCNRRQEDEPWLVVAGDSTLEISASPMQVHSLNQFNRLLLRDRFLRRAAFLVPRDLSFAELPWLIAASLHLGQQLPSSTVLWPDVCTYSISSPPPSGRLQDRSILLLGSISQWETALPSEAPLLLKIANARTGAVRMQGSEANIASFELSLAFVQMMRSPWSQSEWLVAAGSWHDFASPTLLSLLTDAKIAGELHGNICALDADGRLAAYDSRSPAPDSLAERIHSRIPTGLSAEETRERVEAQKAQQRLQGWINAVVSYACGVVFALIVGCRVLLMWERTYLQKQPGRKEPPPLESAP